MNAIESPRSKSIEYPDRTIERAQLALRCSPFRLSLFSTMRDQSVELNAIGLESGLEKGYTKSNLTELACENNLLWLIQVGLLRREVDGQGITDSFRLTPLGRQLVEKYQKEGGQIPQATVCDKVKNTFIRGLGFF
jgi:hypothetical protein